MDFTKSRNNYIAETSMLSQSGQGPAEANDTETAEWHKIMRIVANQNENV